MMNIGNRTQVRVGFRTIIGASFLLFGLTSISSGVSGIGAKLPRIAQAGSVLGVTCEALPLPPKGQTAPKTDKKTNAGSLYRKYCQKCHSSDGTGTDGRDTFPEIPDFTSEKWQKARTKAELVSSILDGKGTSMPQFANKVSKGDVKALADYVRSFSHSEFEMMSATQSDFDKQLQELFEQMKELQKQFRELSNTPAKPQRRPNP
jgi:mono/diheme cytochrome c family protein